ncbi:hypothetical protein LMG22465_12920 [Lactobacillus helveticus]|nr:hypothetical protein LMG22465_12920 [Lactobacillus helveticus]
MVYASNVNVSLQYNLNDYDDGDDDLYHVVVQKGNVGSSYVYALQLLHSQHNIYVFRGSRQKNVNFDKSNPVLRLISQDGYTAGGHTQMVAILKLGNMQINREIGLLGQSQCQIKITGQNKLFVFIFQMVKRFTTILIYSVYLI